MVTPARVTVKLSNSMHFHLPSGRWQERRVHNGWGRGSAARWFHCEKASSPNSSAAESKLRETGHKPSTYASDHSYMVEVCHYAAKVIKTGCRKMPWKWFVPAMTPPHGFLIVSLKNKPNRTKTSSLWWSSGDTTLHAVHFIALCEAHEHEADVSIPIIAQRPAVIMSESHSQ